MSSIVLPLQGAQKFVINEIEAKSDSAPNGQQPQFYQDDGKGNHDLPQDMQDALKGLLNYYGRDVDKLARRTEVVDARRQRFYDRSYQYIYFNYGQSVFVPVVGGVTMDVGSTSVQMPRYCNVYDIYRPYRRNFAAVLSQSPPGVNFEPKEPHKPLDIKTAECAERYSFHYDSVNNVKKMQAKMARLFWTDGRVVGWTRHEKNAEEYGTYDDDKDEQEQAAGEAAEAVAAAATEKTGEEEEDQDEQPEKDAKGEEITTLYGVLEAKCFPITANEIKDLTGIIISDDPDINSMKRDYSWIKSKIHPGPSGSGENVFERNCRLGVLQGMRIWTQSSDSFDHLAERQRMFLRPDAFERTDDKVRDRFKQAFPQGIRVTFISGEYAECFSESLDDCLDVDHALDGDGMNRPSWGKDMVPVQDAYNNYRNMRQEYHDYGIPFIGYDNALVDGNAIREMISEPGQWVNFINPNPAVPLSNYFFVPNALEPPKDLIEAEQDLRDAFSQLVTGVQPALFGGQIHNDDRVGVYQMAREQAMGVMALPWGALQSMFAKFKYQAVLAAAKARREDEELFVKPPSRRGRSMKPISVSIADLKKGNFRAVPKADSAFPETRGAKQAAFDKFMQGSEMNPLLAEAAQQPDNMKLGADLAGIEIDIPAARAGNRQLDEIDQLLAAGPVPPTREQVEAAEMAHKAAVAMAAGAQGQQAPQLPPDQSGPTPQDWDDPTFILSGRWMNNKLMMSLAQSTVHASRHDNHKYHLQEIDDWWATEELNKQIDAGNTAGLANLDLHYDEHKKMLAAQQPPVPLPIPAKPNQPAASPGAPAA